MSYKDYQPLRIFPDWQITWNCFFKEEVIQNRAHLAGNLLYAISEKRKRSIELTYAPEDDPNGQFILKVINLQEEYYEPKNKLHLVGDWGNPHLIFSSKKHSEIVDKIEELLFYLEDYKDERIFKKRGVIDTELETLRLQFLVSKPSEKLTKKLINSNNVVLQNLLLDNKNTLKETIIFLSENGINKGVKNKAKQLLKSKRYRDC